MSAGDDRGLVAWLGASWPPADRPEGDYRRAGSGGTRLVTATKLPGVGAVALARADGTSGWSLVPVVQAGDIWRRAEAGDGVAAGLVRALEEGATLDDGFALEATDAVAASGDAVERAMGVDQTNESVVVGERLVVKWLLHPDPARERAARLRRHLAAAGFREQPPMVGTLTWQAIPDEPPLTIAMVDGWLPGARDGWEWCTEAVVVHAAPGHACAEACPARFGPDLGALVARLHLAFATPTAVIPDPVGRVGRETLDTWTATARRALADALDLTAADDAEAGSELRALEPALSEALAGLGSVSVATVQPIHGDLHVGQVLAGPHGLAIIDLDGNPTADPAALQAPASAARDVAGMLCSLDHVGRVAIRRGADAASVEAWIEGSRSTFLDAYRGTLADAGRADLLDGRLLTPFAVEQECRELIYAARFLPRWRYAPMGAIRAMVSSR